MQGHQARGLHLGSGVGDPVLHRLVAGELLAEGLALQRALAKHVERASRLAQPSHAVVDTARPQARLGDEETLAALPESGAWLPKMIGAHTVAPSISCMRPSFTCP